MRSRINAIVEQLSPAWTERYPALRYRKELPLSGMSETSHHHESRFDLRGTAEKHVTDISTAALEKLEARLHTPSTEISADFVARTGGSKLLVVHH